MREQERLARFHISRVLTDFNKTVRKRFRSELRECIQKILPEFMQREFAGQILSRKYENNPKKANALSVEGMENDEVIGIERFYGRK
jgi:hypothetical protein